jgi:hypothetical protein
MTLGLVFWILMLIWLIFGLVWNWPGGAGIGGPWGPVGNTILLFILFLLLGWHAFGPPVHG